MANQNTLLLELQATARDLRKHHGYTPERIASLLSGEPQVPATVFSTSMSPLRAIVTYLKDAHEQPLPEIAKTLKRDYRAVWGAYQHHGITITATTYYLPLSIFDEEKSILECVVSHLKTCEGLSLAEIARLLDKDPRTIWTVWNRAKKKDETNHGTHR